MNIVPLILQVLALVFLTFAAFNLFAGPPTRPSWGWLGMLLWLVSLMVSGVILHPIVR